MLHLVFFVFLMIRRPPRSTLFLFFLHDTATTEAYTLSLHDALPIWTCSPSFPGPPGRRCASRSRTARLPSSRSEEHTSELQSPVQLECRLLLEKKKTNYYKPPIVKRNKKRDKRIKES